LSICCVQYHHPSWVVLLCEQTLLHYYNISRRWVSTAVVSSATNDLLQLCRHTFCVTPTQRGLLESRQPERKVPTFLYFSTTRASSQLRAALTNENYLQLPSKLFSKTLNLGKVIQKNQLDATMIY